MPHISIRVSEKEKSDYHDLVEKLNQPLTQIIKDALARLARKAKPNENTQL